MFSGPSQWKTFMWNLWRNDGGETVHLTGEVVTVDPVLGSVYLKRSHVLYRLFT